MRLHQESFTFRESAIRDLANSIHLLEKARSEYRAALLWMKDVSMKLQNPDYHNQLTKFREVCECMHSQAGCVILCMYHIVYL